MVKDFQDLSGQLTKQRLYEQLVAEFENLIVTRKIAPGSKLPSERELAEQFATSRTVVREAVKVLKSKGLVAVRHGSGVIVNPQSCWKLIDPLALKVNGSWGHLLELRQILEVETAELASQRWVSTELDAIRQAMENMEAEIDVSSKRIEHDMAFHSAIAKASRNPLLLRVLESVADLMVAQRRALLDVHGAAQRSVKAHRRVYNAIATRKDEEAAQAMYDHLEEIKGDFGLLGWTDQGLLPVISGLEDQSGANEEY
jgi:DNA-binding FadR family transcriptional regulator